jgi:geranylgeranyl diphosphate synthase type II
MKNKVLKESVDNWLIEYFKNKGSYNKVLYEAMEYSVLIGGKRIRPILMLMTYDIYNEDFKRILPIAASIEMIHTYSLIHDDLPAMDNDDLRRGKPTNHKVFGEAVAILAGDSLLNEAVNIMFNYLSSSDKAFRDFKACTLIMSSAGAEGMIGGQVVDIISEGKKIEADVLHYMHRNKTGALIKASIVSGAIMGGADETDIEALGLYGEKLGLAFQIIDDILDIIGTTESLGKKINSDRDNNKTTFISTYGIEKCKEMANMLTDQCVEILNSLNKKTEGLKCLTLYLLNRQE